MAKKKSVPTKESNERRKLESQVDAMMSVETSNDSKIPPAPVLPAKAADDDKKDQTEPDKQPTAPTLPPKLLKTIKGDNAVIEADKSASADKSSEPDNEPSDDKPADATNDEPEAEVAQPEEDTESGVADTQLPDALADNETDKAVDDIVASEANTQLAVDDARARRRTAELEAENQHGLLAAIFTSPWTWLIIVGIAGVTYAWYH